MKKIFLSLALTLSALTASAADYSYLTFQLLDGVQQSVSMDGLKIVFNNGKRDSCIMKGFEKHLFRSPQIFTGSENGIKDYGIKLPL